MSMPEKEFLSKKKCLHEVICFPDGHISIERRAIAYLNRSYIYVITPGSDQLKSVTYNWVHDSTDTETITSSLILAKRRSYQCITYFWDLPDISDKDMIEAKKSYLQNRINDLRKKLDKIEIKYKIECGRCKKVIKNYMKQLESLDCEERV